MSLKGMGARLALATCVRIRQIEHQLGPLQRSPELLCLVFGLFNVPNNRTMFLTAPRERSGAAGGLQGVARLTGQTLGAVAMTLLFEVSPLGEAPRIGLMLGALLTLVAGVISMLRAREES